MAKVAPSVGVSSFQCFEATEYGSDAKIILRESTREIASLAVHNVPEGSASKKDPCRILVKVAAASMNPLDYKLVGGVARSFISIKFPLVIFNDFAGTVVQIPEGAETSLQVGDRVVGCFETEKDRLKWGTGACGQFCAPMASHLLKLPKEVSCQAAAPMGVVCCTVWQSLCKKAGFTAATAAGKKILILGGSSGCGLIAIQLARLWGASEIVTTTSQRELCMRLGATRVINHREGEVWHELLRGEQFDILYNAVEGRSAWDNCGHGILKGSYSGGTCVSIVNDYPEEDFTKGSIFQMLGSLLWRKVASWLGQPNYILSFDTNASEGMAECLELLQEGKLTIPVDPSGPFKPTLEDARRMWSLQQSGRAHGKLVMCWETE
mmetsp:Transcript_39551/g.93108  ORF Transcript_39551/g.93108 Transcript_39551/m.93108 type:complete len:380 (+) Transcript_39551:103-1242(+)